MAFDPMVSFGVMVTGVLSALVGLLALSVLRQKDSRRTGTIFLEDTRSAEYLFDGEQLIDATPAAHSLLRKTYQHETATWPRLLNYLEQEFPGSGANIQNLSTEGVLTMCSPEESKGDPLLLRAELRGGLTRIMISDAEAASSGRAIDPLTRRAIRDELEQLRQISANAPLPIWREALNGDVVWANNYYLELTIQQLGEDRPLVWPLPKIFTSMPVEDPEATQRQKISLPESEEDAWFELFCTSDPNGRQFYGIPANGAVKAEEGLRAFMQTLTKTFAHLSTGLAIFDQDRKLVLFNPALMDLTGLSPDQLIKRPHLHTFFDALREKSMIPEPKDYKSWRAQITTIEEAAATGLYEDVWSLPSGQTYRVVGRPHPNGALALSFEDISTEMSRTRRYRADLELGQAVIDSVDTAIAVFSASGSLVMTNSAYVSLWCHDPTVNLGADRSITTICEHWRNETGPTILWDRVEDFTVSPGLRTKWNDEIRAKDGRLISCQFIPIAAGATMATFQLAQPQPDQKSDLTVGTRKLA